MLSGRAEHCKVVVTNMNNEYHIVVGPPLLRPGVMIETICSEKYLVKCLRKLLEKVREFNIAEGGKANVN